MARSARRRTAGWWLRRLLLLALAWWVLILVGLQAWLGSADFQSRAIPVVVALVEARTGEVCELDAIRVRLWAPAVELQGFRLIHAPTDEVFLSVDHLRAPLVLRGGGPALGRLSIAGPRVEVHLEEDGRLRELRDLVRPGEPMSRLPWSSLQVEDASFRLNLPEGLVEVWGVEVEPATGHYADIRGNLRFRWQDLDERTTFHLPSVTLGPEHVDIPLLRLSTGLFQLQGRGEVPLVGDVHILLSGSADLSRLNSLFEDPTALHGQLALDVAVSGSPADPSLEVSALVHDVGLDLRGLQAHWPVVRYRPGTVSVALQADREGADVERLQLAWGDGRVLATGRITPELELQGARVLAEDISLEHVLRTMDAAPTPWVDMQGDFGLDLEGSLHPVALQGPFAMNVADLRVGDGPVRAASSGTMLHVPRGTARGKLVIRPDEVTIQADRVTGPRTTGRATAVIGTRPRGPLDLQVDIWAADLRDLRPLGGSNLHGRGRLQGRVWGPFNELQVDGFGDVEGFAVTGLPYADRLVTPIRSPDMMSLVFEGARAIKGETPYGGDFTLDFRDPMSMDTTIVIEDGRVEDVVGVFIDLPGLTGEMRGTLLLRGPLYDMDGYANLVLGEVDLWGERFERGEAHGFMDQGIFTLDDLRVLRRDGTEGMILRGSVARDWKLNMELVGDGLRLEHLDHLAPAELPIQGRLSFAARIDNNLFDPAPHGRLAVTDVRYQGHPVEDSWLRFQTRDGVTAYTGSLVGDTASLSGTLGLWGEQPYRLDAAFVGFPAHTLYPVAADGSPVDARATGTLALSGRFGDEPSPVDLTLDLTDVTVAWSHHLLRNDRPWHYAQQGRAFGLHGFSLVGGRTRFELEASGGVAPLRVDGFGRVDADLLRAVVPGLLRSEGTADVQVSVTGRQPDLEAVVDVDFDGALVRHESFPGAFEDLAVVVRATDDLFEIVSAQGGLGGGTVEVEGRILADRWTPRTWDLAGTASDVQLQWVDYLPPAIGDAELRFDGPVDALLLSGRVDLREAVFSDRIDWEDWVVAWREHLLVDTALLDDEAWFNMDLAIAANRTIRLRNNVAEGVASADLRVVGDTARPGLLGSVHLDDGIFYLQDREFRVGRGIVAFRDPWTWDPDLDFELITDINSRERRYRVNYQVRGPFSDWRTETRSDPPLPQADINALLWFGVTADDLEEMGELPQAIGQGVADLILADLLVSSQAAQDLRDEFVYLDRVDLVTGVNARGEYSSDPRLLLGKRLGRWDLTGEINMVRPDDHYYRGDIHLLDGWSLSLWYATRQRERVLAIGGAYGIDLRARWEAD